MIDLNKKKLLIFDCDGVLIDSTAANAAYFDHCLERAGYPPLDAKYREQAAFMSIQQLIRTVFGETDESERVYNLSKRVSYAPFLDTIELKFNFADVLGSLRKRFYLAVASNRGKSLVSLFSHFYLFDYFHFKISAIEAEAKPSPDMLNRCVDYFGVNQGESVFFGDAESDLLAARAAGVDYCWVGRTTEEPNIGSVRDLPEIIECGGIIRPL